MKSFCIEHPYYFIDILDLGLVKKLFYQYLDKELDTIAMAADILHMKGLGAAYEYVNKTMGLSENIDELVKQTEEHLIHFNEN